MTPSVFHNHASAQHDILLRFIPRLESLYRKMDKAYETCADIHGFICRGCEDNCCRTRFYHHTLLEAMAIYSGYVRMTPRGRERVNTRAIEYCRQHAEADAAGTRARPWCPLNEKGRCLVYDLRPMICRLHGIPHVLHLPNGKTVQGPGCDDFMSLQPSDKHPPLDRTPFYKELSGLEKAFRAELNANAKFRQTIAEMIMSFNPGDSAEDPTKSIEDTP